MKISILTLFPEMFSGPFDYSIVKRTQEKKLVSIDIKNIRDFGIGKHKLVDDTGYGGGTGMILRIDVLEKALDSVRCKKETHNKTCKELIILTDPRGNTFTQKKARQLTQYDHLIFIAGHYEGVDQRTNQYLVNESISIGDYILTGGEIPVMVMVDAIVRLLPGALKPQATDVESFTSDFLEYPQYTKPSVWNNKKVPDVLLSGNHNSIESWRKKHSKKIKRIIEKT